MELWLSTKTSVHTRRAYAHEAGKFLQSIGGKPLAEITLADLQSWIASAASEGLKPASLNRAITAVKSLLSFCFETGYIRFNPGAAVKRRPQRDGLAQRILGESEIRRLIAAAPEGRDRGLLTLLYYSGLRVSEACNLRHADLRSRRDGTGQITVFGKGGRTRTILLPPAVWSEVYVEKADPAAPVFASRKGGGPLDSSQARRIVYAAAKAAGLPHAVSPHWMRHAHASHALDHSAPLHLVQATLGHASIATTGRYLHARPTESSGLYLREPKD